MTRTLKRSIGACTVCGDEWDPCGCELQQRWVAIQRSWWRRLVLRALTWGRR